MVEFIREVATDISLPNITTQRLYADGVHVAFELTVNPGYVIYNTSADYMIPDEDGNMVELISYFRFCCIPADIPVENWTWVAVPDSDIPAEQIF